MSNIDPKFWGSGLWKTMYSVAESLPDDTNNVSGAQIQNIKTFFTVLSEVIPCEDCRTNYKSDIIRIEFPRVVNNKTVGEWVVKINNSVNNKINIPPVKYEDIVKEISEFKTEREIQNTNIPNTISNNTIRLHNTNSHNMKPQNMKQSSFANKAKMQINRNTLQSKHQRDLRIKESKKRNIRKPAPKNTRLNKIVGSQSIPSQQSKGLNVKKPCNCGKKR
jgi:Erv1 / Alr family